ncbi:PilZ-like domain-containing protein [Geotalea toluenoxydans]|uniref:PilZ-like domain-containing protein n=1 Tax=Geotalea toluenoxydans TaxID=421624 RepID=UPI0006D0B10A|nr:PilZ-like domain-containing protein [Geotalea toluenoxydans]
MTATTVKYEDHFKPDQQINAAVRLMDKKLLESNAIVTTINADLLSIELIGDGLPDSSEVEIGTEFYVTYWTGWAHYRCNGRLEKVDSGNKLQAKLVGPVIEQQRRDYFRLDLVMPVEYRVLKNQPPSIVEEEWNAERGRCLSLPELQLEPFGDGFKVVEWRDGEDLLPMEMNLSGGGIRLKLPEAVAPGTLMGIDLFLPLVPSRIIRTVAEVVRCNEITLRWEKGTQYRVATRFIHINERERETIISFIFSEQRRLLQLSQDRIVPIR